MKLTSIFTCSLLFLLTFSACRSQEEKKSDLNVEQFEKGIASAGIQILDVRTQNEYNSGHLKNALLADWNSRDVFIQRVQSLDKNKPVYTYCLSGARSNAAKEWLKTNGFKEVYNLQGGINAWKRADKPVEGVQQVQQVTLAEFMAAIPKDKTVLVDVGAVWCPPCKKMEPTVDELARKNPTLFQLVKVDGGQQETLARELNAINFPTFIVYRNGKETWRKEGIVSGDELLNAVR